MLPLPTAGEEILLTFANVAVVTQSNGCVTRPAQADDRSRTVTLTDATRTVTLDGLNAATGLIMTDVPVRTTVAVTTLVKGEILTQTVVLVPEPQAQLQRGAASAHSSHVLLITALLILPLLC